MKEEKVSDELLRQFLLGTTGEDEREQIEGLFLTDSDLRDRVLGIEQDLIEDYLENSLTTVDRERFLRLFAQTPKQQQQLRITKSIKDRALAEAFKTESVSSAPIPRDVRKRSWLRLSFAVPIAVALAIAIVFAIVWVNRRNEHFAIEQELARLNSPENLRENPQNLMSRELKPVNVRSVEPAFQLNRSADDGVLELRLLWMQKERYPTYHARLRGVGDGRLFTLPTVQPSSDGMIRLRLSAKILTSGNYRIELSGIASDGSPGYTEEYNFTVGR